MTLRELKRELEKLDQKWLDSEVVVFQNWQLDRFYASPGVSITADSRIRKPRVVIYPTDKSAEHGYEELYDGEEHNDKTQAVEV